MKNELYDTRLGVNSGMNSCNSTLSFEDVNQVEIFPEPQNSM